jgi:hypothetical protein
MHRLFRILSVLIMTIASTTGAMAATYNKLYVFGASYSDIGAGYLDWSGPTAVAYLAQKMNIPLTHSSDTSLRTAVDSTGTLLICISPPRVHGIIVNVQVASSIALLSVGATDSLSDYLPVNLLRSRFSTSLFTGVTATPWSVRWK